MHYGFQNGQKATVLPCVYFIVLFAMAIGFQISKIFYPRALVNCDNNASINEHLRYYLLHKHTPNFIQHPYFCLFFFFEKCLLSSWPYKNVSPCLSCLFRALTITCKQWDFCHVTKVHFPYWQGVIPNHCTHAASCCFGPITVTQGVVLFISLA